MDLAVKKDYLIFELIKANTKDGRQFLKMVMSDENGKLLNAIMFDSNKLNFEPKKGDMVKVTALLQYYNNQPQLKISDMEYLSSGKEIMAENFLPKSKNDPDEMFIQLEQLFIKHVKNECLIKLYKKFFNDKEMIKIFKMIPAAKNVHHAYVHGLLEHTLGVTMLAIQVSLLYPQINKEILMLGALFHDMGKVDELSIDTGFDYSNDGKFLGHILIGYSKVNEYISGIADFPVHLKQQILHIIASHHGQLDFGSPVVPKTVDAIMLNFIDDIDAKMNAVDSVFNRDGISDDGWSNYDRLLERQLFKSY